MSDLTREEAIEVIEQDIPCEHDRDLIEALEMSISALSNKGDSISRQAVLDTLENTDKFLDEERTVDKYKELLTECIKVLPSVENKGDTTWGSSTRALKR